MWRSFGAVALLLGCFLSGMAFSEELPPIPPPEGDEKKPVVKPVVPKPEAEVKPVVPAPEEKKVVKPVVPTPDHGTPGKPAPTEGHPEISKEEAARAAIIARYVKQLSERKDFIKVWKVERDPRMQAKLRAEAARPNGGLAKHFYTQVGEMIAIMKNLVGFAPHMFDRPITVAFEGNVATIIDVTTKLSLGKLTLNEDGSVEKFEPVDANIAKVIKESPDKLRLMAKATPEEVKMAAASLSVYYETYDTSQSRDPLIRVSRAAIGEGFMEQLAKDVLKIPEEANHRELFTRWVSGRNYSPNYNHNSTMMVFEDKATGKRLGIVGFHYEPDRGRTGRPTEVRIVNSGVGPTRGNNLLDDVRIKLHNYNVEQQRKATTIQR